jgi:glycosyltransferase involved in cell wall biosynthesis
MILVTSKANPIWHFRRGTGGPRRVVHVPPRFASSEWSGTEAVVLELAKQQLGSGMDPVIISTLALSEIRHEVIDGVRVQRHPHSYFVFGAGKNGAKPQGDKSGNLLSIPVFQSLMQEPDVRLFHTHTLGRLGGEVLHASRMRFRPFVATVHEDPNIGSIGGSSNELKDADMVVFASKFEADHAIETLGHDRIAHLPHGVDCARFAAGDGASVREAHGIPPQAFVVGSPSRSDAGKILLLLEAFAQARAWQPGMHLLINTMDASAGDAAQFDARIVEHGLGAHVHMLSGIQNKDRANVINACDALVLLPPQKVMPSDVLEAWSASRPLVGDRFSGIGNFVSDRETGLLFDPESPAASEKLAAHIELLAADETLRRQIGERGRVEAQAHDWSRIGARLEEIYQLAEKHHLTARQQGRIAA